VIAGAMDEWKIYDVNFSISCKETEKWTFNTIRWRKAVEVWTVAQKEDVQEFPF
jgi:hypothetical protein